MVEGLKEGDKIITKGGIIGIIQNRKENSFIITLHDGTQIEILKHAVISIIDENI